jgi:hypothetical protein
VNHIASWDGAYWRAIGFGVDDTVNALAVYNGELYAGGDFATANGASVPYLARWTGGSWQAVGFGTDGPVRALAVNGAELLVGGSFHNVGGFFQINSPFFARWTQGNWDRYTAAPNDTVTGLAPFNGFAAAIIEHEVPGGLTRNLYRWTGSTWAFVGEAVTPGGVVAFNGNLLYSGVDPAHICGTNSSFAAIRSYNGTTSTTVQNATSATGFTVSGGVLYALGVTTGTSCDLRYPQSWLGICNSSGTWGHATPAPGPIGVVGLLNGDIYVAGQFAWVNGDATVPPPRVEASNIARLFNSRWTPLTSGFDGAAKCSTQHGGAMYVGGDFTHEGANAVGYAATYNGFFWQSTVAANGPLTHMNFFSTNPTLADSYWIISGSFTSVNSTAISYIAKRDPQTLAWSSLGSGINAPALTSLQVFGQQLNQELIVGGQFTIAGGQTVNHIAKWTGAAWLPFGSGINGDVRAIAIYNSQVIAGGSFTTAGGNAASNIAAWNGSAWAPLGPGFNGTVRALISLNGVLYAGGDFTAAGATPVSHIAQWNGTAWAALGGGVDGPVNTMLLSSSILIVGGSFAHAGPDPFSNIAQWNGTAWSAVGLDFDRGINGVDGAVNTITLAGNTLLAGGLFHYATGQFSPFVARAVTPRASMISAQPTAAAACVGDQASFTFGLSQSWFLHTTYTWYHNGTLLNDGPSPYGSTYVGAHTETLAINNVRPGDAGSYYCFATTDCNEQFTSATVQLTVGGGSCPPVCGSADFNCDGDVGTDADIESFFRCLAGNCPGAPCPSSADFNADGDVGTDADIEAFFRVLAGGSC